ncbi:unnamed protein product [Darwinula stevensoni]|uniref:Intraflagellar transport protein 57 homolog n=1 Tax=Darwinula stevensoni TaxID=69355 RepID=A0A7R8X1Q0_9CRUS|nr:unnamed protein product [Darwinula stevensoni]CAG0880335.1 unnamed protein product [Darwinula stevensoni]
MSSKRSTASKRRQSNTSHGTRRQSVTTEDHNGEEQDNAAENPDASAEPEDGGPGLLYLPFVVMEELLDKLKLLSYEKDFLRQLQMKPMSRHYFAIQSNPGEQFYLFSSLAAWLINKTGRPFEQPQEHDDPNSTITNILDVLRNMGVNVDFPPSKLKQGYGEQAIYVLDRLADKALETQNFEWQKPILTEANAEEDDEEEREDEAEITLDKMEEETLVEDTDEEEEETILNLDELKGLSKPAFMMGMEEIKKPAEILTSNTNAEEWRLEVERVLPQLKVTLRNDMRDWRAHVEQMHTHRDGIEESLKSTQGQLDKLHADIARTLEKIGSREKYLNNQLEHQLTEFRSLQDQLAQARQQYSQVSGGVVERKEKFRELSTRLETLKEEMERRGSAMTDGSPLVNIRKALTRLRQEVTGMDVRIGVVEHTLLQARLRDRSQMQRDMHSLPSQSQLPVGLY